jgi:hypothetical protein
MSLAKLRDMTEESSLHAWKTALPKLENKFWDIPMPPSNQPKWEIAEETATVIQAPAAF